MRPLGASVSRQASGGGEEEEDEEKEEEDEEDEEDDDEAAVEDQINAPELPRSCKDPLGETVRVRHSRSPRPVGARKQPSRGSPSTRDHCSPAESLAESFKWSLLAAAPAPPLLLLPPPPPPPLRISSKDASKSSRAGIAICDSRAFCAAEKTISQREVIGNDCQISLIRDKEGNSMTEQTRKGERAIRQMEPWARIRAQHEIQINN